MSKRLILTLMIWWALTALGLTAFNPADRPIRISTAAVSRQDVHQVKAITGRLCYEGEEYIVASDSGIVTKVCVVNGQRVAENEALIRMETENQTEPLSEHPSHEYMDIKVLSARCSIRSKCNANVRQVLVKEGEEVGPGMPLLRLSSNEQVIRCIVSSAEAEDMTPGQWAWIFSGEEKLGFAEIGRMVVHPQGVHSGTEEMTVILKPVQHIDLAEGAQIDAEIFLAGSDDVLALPTEAITERGTVWWVNEGRCTEIPAQIVLCDEMYAWVNLPEGLLVAIGEFVEGQLVTVS